MSNEFLAIILMLAILGVVIIAWRIRAESDKGKEGMRKPGVSGAGKKSQVQASIERLERKQAETSRRLDQIIAARSKTVKKAAPRTTTVKKTARKPKAKK